MEEAANQYEHEEEEENKNKKKREITRGKRERR